MKKSFIALLLLTLFFTNSVFAENMGKEWTHLIFINGDNNLSNAGKDDINEMETVGSTEDFNIVVEYDSVGSNGTKRYYIEKDSDMSVINSPVVMDMPEQDTGSWEHALEFFKWGVDNYPAEKYIITFWNHGAGWQKSTSDVLLRGISYDDDSHNHITTPELGMIAEKLHEHIGRKIDIISYDACLMQMVEIAYEIKEHCLYQVGAEETEPFDGWPFDGIFKQLEKNPSMSGEEFGRHIVKEYGKSYMGGTQGSKSTTLSLVDLSEISNLKEKVNRFADILESNVKKYADKYQKAISRTQSYSYSQYKDLGDFCKNIIEQVDDYSIKNAAEDVQQAISDYVLEYSNTASSVEDSTGTSIYIPTKSQLQSNMDSYSEIKWAKDSKWDEFLVNYYFPNYAIISFKSIDVLETSGDDIVSQGEVVEFKVNLKNEGAGSSDRVEVSIKENEFVSLRDDSESVYDIKGLSECSVDGLSVKIKDNCPDFQQVVLTFNVSGKDIDVDYNIPFIVRSPFSVQNNVLLIVDDSNSTQADNSVKALRENGIEFDMWDNKTEEKDIPYSYLKEYVNGIVIYNAQFKSDLKVIKNGDMKKYLDAGGNLFISGQDIGYKLKSNSFYEDYMHAEFVQDNTKIYNLVSQTEMFPDVCIQGGTGSDDQKWPDEIKVLEGAEVLFRYSNRSIQENGDAALFVEDKGYRLIYFSFNFDAISEESYRTKIMKESIERLRTDRKDRLEDIYNITQKIMTSRSNEEIDTLLNIREKAEIAAYHMFKNNIDLLKEYDLDRNIYGGLIDRVNELNFNK